MSPLQLFIQGLGNAFNPVAILYIVAGIIWGIIGGATPGISASIAMALALPFTFGMNPMYSLPMLSAIYVGAEYGGSIPGILIKTPGTPSAAASAIEGYELHKKGLGGKALHMSLYAGVIGGIISVLILIGTVIPLSQFALKFGPTQYFWLSLMGLSMVAAIGGKNPIKGLMAGIFGLFLATIGTDTFTGCKRYTLGLSVLSDGLELTGVMVGLFAMAECLKNARDRKIVNNAKLDQKVSMTRPSGKEFKECFPVIGLSGILGTFLGALPGAGTTIASWMAYTQAKLMCKGADKTFGTGDLRGVAAPESANNAVPAGALIPMLALGIPGSNSTAIMMAGFTMAGIATGPMLFVNRPDIPYMIMACMFVSQLLLLAVGFVLMRPFIKLTSMNQIYLSCGVLTLCLLGAYSSTNVATSMVLVLIMGVLGLGLISLGFPAASMVLGFVLGELVEDNLRRSLQLSRGSINIFFKGPMNIILIVLTVLCLIYPYVLPLLRKKKDAAKEEK
ncbi:MAG: tripartite tricarboxylate transporter permease [Oscillospiraceae bacterium]|nr:tripartite tricarboxylate transporter permease [Oscillospiraceae bacterium]